MYTLKRFQLSVLAVLLLFGPCRITRGDDTVVLLATLASVYGIVLGGIYLCSLNSSPEQVLTEAKKAEEIIREKHAIILEICECMSDDDFRNKLYEACSNAASVASLFIVRSDLQILSEQTTQLQKTKNTTQNLTLERITQLSEQEEALTKLHKSLLEVSKRFEDHRQYFDLREALELCKKMPTIDSVLYPNVHLVQNIRAKEQEVKTFLAQDKLVGYQDLIDDALYALECLTEEQNKIEQTEMYLAEYRSYLEHESKLALQAQKDAEAEKRAQGDRECKQNLLWSDQKNKIGWAVVGGLLRVAVECLDQ